MTFLHRLRNYFFNPYDDLLPKEEVVEVKKESVIGEPVVSMAKSILETDDWDMENVSNAMDFNYDRSRYILQHRHKAVSITLLVKAEQRERIGNYGSGVDLVLPEKWTVTCDWMSEDERNYMVEVLVKYRAMQEQKAVDAYAKEMAEKRARVASLLNIEVPTQN